MNTPDKNSSNSLNTEFERQRRTPLKSFSRSLKRSKKYLEKARTHLTESLNWEQIQHQATLLQSNLYRIKKGMTDITVSDWLQEGKEVCFSLERNVEPHVHVGKLFRRSKKLRIGIPYWTLEVEKAEKQVAYYLEAIEGIKSAQSLEELMAFEAPIVEKRNKAQQGLGKCSKSQTPLPYRTFYSSTGLMIWVGKGAKANDQMTFHHANGSDFWLHVQDYPGSHVVLKVNKDQEPDQQSILEAMQLAVAYSKAKDRGIVSVCITQCKYVKRAGKNVPGKVFISKHRVGESAFDLALFKAIQDRSKRS